MNAAVQGRSRLVLTGAWIMLGFLTLPALIALPVSVTNKRFLSLPQGGISFAHYQALLTSDEWVSSALQSLGIALSASMIATVLGTLCAIGLWRIASRMASVLRTVLLLPLIIPPIISAMAFYRAWVSLHLLDTFTGVILAHAILATPMVLITVSASLANFDIRLEQASRSLGAPLLTTLRRVVLPAIRPGILGGAIFAFILSWDEVVVVLFISSFRIYTLPRRIWDGIRDNTDPAVAAAAVVLIAITLVAMLLFAWFARRQQKSPST